MVRSSAASPWAQCVPLSRSLTTSPPWLSASGKCCRARERAGVALRRAHHQRRALPLMAAHQAFEAAQLRGAAAPPFARCGEPQVAQHFERTQQHRQRRTARGDALQALIIQRGGGARNETLHESVVMLSRVTSNQVAHLEISRAILLKPVGPRVLAGEAEQLVEQARAGHALAQTLLVGGNHE